MSQVFRMNGWNTPSEYLEYVHPHWLKYEAPNPFMHHMLGVLYVIFMFGSLIGNGVVIYIFSSCKSLRTPGNFLVVNLAICDFIMMLKTPIFISNSFNEGPLYGRLGCEIFGIMGSISGIGAAVTNTAISFDRYRTITNPFDGKLTQGKVLMLILAIWIYALPFTILPAMEVWGRFVPEGYLTSCTFDYMGDTPAIKAFVACIFVYSYCIPMSMTAFFYSKIVGHVRDHENLLREQAKKMNVESLRSNKDLAQQSAEIRIAKVAIGIVVLFLLSWTPYAICALISAFGNSYSYHDDSIELPSENESNTTQKTQNT
ncbi:Opsin, ultraviolet-sensitive [Orchesella cincta]|uniref:Opsin, ultraviolet-sensitive n=1 Tax=Orchesella cincta TaxID=48709 RepID=A0A1D2N1Y7_ORCCI|nr:Opsin, ultraviolet-sensitive [Orchesella cincta]